MDQVVADKRDTSRRQFGGVTDVALPSRADVIPGTARTREVQPAFQIWGRNIEGVLALGAASLCALAPNLVR